MVDAGNSSKGFKYTAGAAAYQYDANGNMTQDNHKQFTFAYNYLNLPASMTKGTNVITMTYTADGEKLAKAVTGGATKNYLSGIEYSGANLEAIYFSEGRCTPDGSTAFFYEYTIKDHLGNARVNFRAGAGASLTALENMHYYPFGMLMEGLGTNSPANDYTYNGKELNEDFGLNLSDYGARWYDAALGRWWSVDPLAHNFLHQSPYAAFDNNPINVIDLDGRSGVPIIDKENKTITVHTEFIFYGGAATAEISKETADEIETQYNDANGKVTVDGEEYSVSFKITYQTVTEDEAIKLAGENTDAKINFVRVEKNNIRKNRSFYMNGENSGFMNTDDNLGTSTTAPHEAGHGYGLSHSSADQRGKGQPDIMTGRGSLVDPEYQYDPKAVPGERGGTINPITRKVTQGNITDMFKGVTFDKNGKGQIGTATNRIFDADGYEN